MTPRTEPTFWLLEGPTGWRTGTAEDVTVGETSGIQLTADPNGPLAPTSPDGSLGGLALPPTVAIDADGAVYLLDVAARLILRFDPSTRSFLALPAIGPDAREPRELFAPTAIAIAGRRLYAADPAQDVQRVLVFALPSLALVDLLTIENWEPVDLASHGDHAYILDRRHGRVLRHRGPAGRRDTVLEVDAASDRWSRLTLDRDGRLYLLNTASAAFDIFDAGVPQPRPRDPGDVRDRFDPPPIRFDADGRFCLPESLARPCGRTLPDTGPPPDGPRALCTSDAEGLLFDRRGRPAVRRDVEPPGPPLYQASGTWISDALDSAIYRCQWHRIALELGAVPSGTHVAVSTYTDARPLRAGAIATLPESRWSTNHTVTGRTQQAADEAGARQEEFLIQSREGQYLWLRLQLRGDTYGTPVVRSVRIHYPRESYLAFLPEVYSSDDDSRWFLQRFLSVFQTEWDAIEDTIEHIERLFDPNAVPGGQALEYLAAWLALPLEGTWNDEQRRALLSAVPALVRRRGTADGLRSYMRVYLENMTGLALDDTGYPHLVEGFRERERLLLSTGSARLGEGAPLWSPSVVGRFQVDVFAREGEARLLSTRDPERDLFHEFAHRFRVFVPATWVRTGADERMLRRAIDEQKPAHTGYDLCLVEPRFRVGVQSTIGLDTIVAAPAVGSLACHHDRDPAPSLPPRHRLGYDTVLSCTPANRPTPKVGGAVRLM